MECAAIPVAIQTAYKGQDQMQTHRALSSHTRPKRHKANRNQTSRAKQTSHLEVLLVEGNGFRELRLRHTGVRVDVELEPVLLVLAILDTKKKGGGKERRAM